MHKAKKSEPNKRKINRFFEFTQKKKIISFKQIKLSNNIKINTKL